LEGLAPGWDALAVACRRPRSAPVWTVAWYRHALPPGALIRTVVVADGDDVVGIAPFYVMRSRFGFYRYLLAAPMLHGVEPLCVPGREEEIGRAIGTALAGAQPSPDTVSLGWMSVGSPLPRAVHGGWPKPGSVLVDEHSFAAPRVLLSGSDFEKWLAERSKKFRKMFRYDHRRLVAEGFEHRVSVEAPDILERLPHLQRLYELRRAVRGGTGPQIDGPFMNMMSEAVVRSPLGRVSISTIERSREVIAIDLIISGGGESSVWLSGFEEAWASMGPNRVNMALCIGDALKAGDAVFDLGPGAEPYKYRFTEDEATLQGHVLSRRGLRPFHTPAQLLPYGARKTAARAVGRLRRLV
jgi:CelD/BcsL family acetyltransferase involved in cellulose biosynthesis